MGRSRVSGGEGAAHATVQLSLAAPDSPTQLPQKRLPGTPRHLQRVAPDRGLVGCALEAAGPHGLEVPAERGVALLVLERLLQLGKVL